MAVTAKALSYPQAADELVRAAWAYATGIDHRPLMARLRLEASDVAYWNNRPRQARDLAASGLSYLSAGPNASLLHLQFAGAAARLGDADDARRAINAASDARESDHADELLDIGGEFGFSLASQHYYAGRTLPEIPQGQADAVTELQNAAEQYAAGPEPGEDHSQQCEMLAHTDLATAHLRTGQLDGGIAALGPVVALSPGSRTDLLTQRLTAVRAELARPLYRNSSQGNELDGRIEEFTRETIVADLHDLPANLG